MNAPWIREALSGIFVLRAFPLAAGGDPAECGHFHHTTTANPNTTSTATTLRTPHTYPI